MTRRMLRLLFAPLIIYAIIVFGFYLGQRRLQYYPSNDGLTPQAVGLANVAVENIAADGERLVLWYSPAKPGEPTILFFQGNAGEIGSRPDRFSHYQSAGFGVAFLSYRGYGGSTGSPSEAGLIADALTAYDWLIARGVSPDDLLLVGESLGTGVAVQLAAQRPVAAMALEAPFSSAADVGVHHYPWLPVRALMKDQFRSIDVLDRVKVPLIVLHGDRDQIVPYDLGRKFFAAASEPKQFATLRGGDHFSIFDQRVWQHEIEFFRSVLKEKSRRDPKAAAAQ